MSWNFRKNYKVALICSTIASCAVPLSSAMAKDAGEAALAAETAEAGEMGAAIIVSGSISQAQEASVDAKREATNITDILSADAIGRFPDQTIADSLSRLPGVAVQRDQGQARYIQVRGAPNRWTSVSIDGVPQTGVDESGDTRAYRFDAVPSVLLSEMRINKSLTPDITAEAITANIDLITYSPLKEEGLSVTGDIGYGFMDLGDGEQRQGSIRAGWSNGTWAVALGGSHYRRKQITDNREAEYDASGVPLNIDVRNYKLTRENNGLFGTVEFSPAEGQRFFVRGIYTEFNDDEQRNAYQFELNQAASGTRGALTGDLVGVPVTGNFNDGRYRNKNFIASTGMNFDSGNGTEYNVVLGFTRTENSTDLPLVRSNTTGLDSPSLHYDRSEDPRFPIISLYETVGTPGAYARGAAIPTFDQTSLSAARAVATPVLQDVVSNAYTAKFDMNTEAGGIQWKAGLLGTIRDIKGNTIGISGAVPLGATGFNINDYVTDKPWHTGFPLGITLNYFDNKQMNKDLQAVLDRIGFDPSSVVTPASFYDQTESIAAGYAMGTFDLGDVSLTGGARLEYYKLENSGTALIDRVATPLSKSDDTFDVFPSLTARYNVTDDFVVRLAGQRGVSRPAYAAIRVGASVSDTTQTISGGNPDLKAEYTWGLDGSLEYYLPGGGLISVAGFYRWVDDVLYQSQQPLNSDIYNTPGFDRSGYRLTSTFNGSDGKLYGVEFNVQQQFNFLPGFLSGFGVQGNLTLLDGDFKALQPDGSTIKSPFPGMSDTIVNASLFYEKYGLSAMVSYQWRSDYLDTLGGLGSGEHREAYDNLDVSVRYAINDNLTVFADLANLTNAIYGAYEGTPATPTEVEQIGARYMFGIRFGF